MKAYVRRAYSVARWSFIIWAAVFLVGGAVFVSDLLTVPNTAVSWHDVAMSGVLSLASLLASFVVLFIRRTHEALAGR